MFRTFPLSIIRSFSLYTQQWYMSYRFADSLRARSECSILIFFLLLLLLELQLTVSFSLLSDFLPLCPFFTSLSPLSYSHYLQVFFNACNPSLPWSPSSFPLAPSEVARWVLAAWKAIPESIIIRSFKKCCISNALDGSEDDIVREDDVKDKDDSDWLESMDNDSVMSDDGESDE